jgi:uncharacterized protein with PIN domain
MVKKIRRLIIEFELWLHIFERCSICGRFLYFTKIRNYYGGIEDKTDKKIWFVCMQCYDWFYSGQGKEIKKGRICLK